MWFDQSAQFDYDDNDPADPAGPGTLRVAVPNRFIADGIDRHFHDALEEAAQQEIGERVHLDVQIAPERFTIAAPADDAFESIDAHPTDPRPARSAARLQRPGVRVGRPAAPRTSQTTALRGLRHRLDEFIVGPSNQLAFAAAQRLADDETETGAPLFIHGGCGLGKTHLLQGICRHVLEQHPDARVLYTTGEQFTNEYITAVRSNKLERFRKWIRGLDLLAVDDVHFIANKQATQQEFLHSFDQIELSGARVALASDSHPKLIEQFSEALVSRCVRGLVVPVKPPDPKTRARLVQVLAERRSLHLSPQAAQAIGQQSQGSVREIEGALTKLHALVTLSRQNGERVAEPIGRQFVQQLLDVDASHAPRAPIRFEHLLEAVCQELGVTSEQVLGRGRHRIVVLARSLTVHLARQLTSMSYPEIAAALGRDNHSTVITAAQRITRQLKSDAPTALPPHLDGETLPDLVDRLKRQIKG